MKALKYIISALFIFSLVWSCTDNDDFGSTDFVDTATAPANLSARFDVTTDNTGLVTITPNGEGATFFDVAFGDNSGELATLKLGESVQHVYGEGSYDVKLTGYGITGLETEQSIPLNVSFKAPENLEVTISNDDAVSKKVNVIATADYALVYDVYFGEEGNDEPVTANIGEVASYIYQEAGVYTIRVVAKSAAIETREYTEDFEAVAIVQPIESAPVPPGRAEADVISIFTEKYANVQGTDYFPDWGQAGQGSGWAMFELNGDEMLQYINLSYQGISIGETIDVSGMEYLHLDVWTADVARIETSLINGQDGNSTEKPVWSDLTADQWTSIEIPISAWTDQGLSVDEIFQLKFVGDPWAGGTVFVDNIYFWKEPSAASELVGSWKIAPEAEAIAVGPARGAYDWWGLNRFGDDLTARQCWLDDQYVFGADGTFQNIQDGETWLEPFQGFDPEQCGAPVAPHDGTSPATYSDSGASITLNGLGAYLGLAKVHNTGEDGAPVDNTIVYDYTLSPDGNTLEIFIDVPGGSWYYKMIRGEAAPSKLIGTWKIAPEAEAIAVGPAMGAYDWWGLNRFGDDLTARACWLDDEYIFGADGTFQNVQDGETWLEPFQGFDPEQCGAPVAPHDGTSPATFTDSGSTVTLVGLGAYLGLAKVHNTGENGVPVDNTIVYNYTLSPDGGTLEIFIDVPGGSWYYKLIKQ